MENEMKHTKFLIPEHPRRPMQDHDVDSDIDILKETVACIYPDVCLMLISCYYDIVEPWNIYVMPDTIEIKWVL